MFFLCRLKLDEVIVNSSLLFRVEGHSRVLGGSFSGVNLHVGFHGAFLLVALPTHLAAVRFLPRVRQHVSLQVDLLHEALGAELAAERLLFLVEPLVCLQ